MPHISIIVTQITRVLQFIIGMFMSPLQWLLYLFDTTYIQRDSNEAMKRDAKARFHYLVQ